MMNRMLCTNAMSICTSACTARTLSSFAFDAASFFSTLRFYFYYFFPFDLPSKRKLIS